MRGPVPTEQPGTTLMREHVFGLTPHVLSNYPAGSDQAERVADAVDELNRSKALSVDTIADPTVVAPGCYLPCIQQIDDRVGINVVAGWGYDTYNDIPFPFHYRDPAPSWTATG